MGGIEQLHIEGYGIDIYRNILDALSDNYDLPVRFDFNEESEEYIKNVFIRFYECINDFDYDNEENNKCTLDEAMKGHITQINGGALLKGKAYGYSEYTIEGFTVNSLKLGNHDLREIFENKGYNYIHVLMDIL